MNDFITTLFKTKREDGSLSVQDDELTAWKKRIEKINSELFDFVADNLDEKLQERFNQIMLEFEENTSAKAELENELYFKSGVKQGIEIYETLKNK